MTSASEFSKLFNFFERELDTPFAELANMFRDIAETDSGKTGAVAHYLAEEWDAHTKGNKLSEDYNVQVSGNIGESLVVFRGKSMDEIKAKAREYTAGLSELYDILNDAKQIVTVKEVFTAKKSYGGGGGSGGGFKGGSNNGGGGGSKPAAQNTATQAPDGSYSCEHGAMKLLNYKKADGKRVHGHYCQAPRNAPNKCKPVTLDGHGQ